MKFIVRIVLLIFVLSMILFAGAVFAHGQTVPQGPTAMPQLNTDFYVGQVPGFYPTIQSAVTKACATTGARVIIPAGATPSDSPTAVTDGCTKVTIRDVRALPDTCYGLTSGSYVVTPCVAGSGGSAGSPQDLQFAGATTGTFAADHGFASYTAGTTHSLNVYQQNISAGGVVPGVGANVPWNATAQTLSYFNYLANTNISGQDGGIGTTYNVTEAAPGHYPLGHESGGRGIVMNGNFYTTGISQFGPSGNCSFWGGGDKTCHAQFFQWAAGGYGNGDDEGPVGWTDNASDLGVVPVGTISSIDTPNHGVRTTANSGSAKIGSGRPLIQTSSSLVSGCQVTADTGVAGGAGLPSLTVSGCTLPVSTVWGQTTGPINTPDTFQTMPVSVSVPVVIQGGASAGYSTSSFVCVGDATRFQAARVTAVSGAAGIGNTQTLSVNLTEPFLGSQFNAYLYQGPLCETAGREDASVRGSGSGAMDLTFNIIGATDAHTLVYDIPLHNSAALISSYDPDVIATTYSGVGLTRNGSTGTVSALYNSGGIPIPVGISLVVTDAGDFNGTFTTTPGICGTQNCISWAQAGSNEQVSGANLAPTIAVQGLNIYHSAEIVGVMNPAPVADWGSTDATPGNYLQLRDNDLTWTTGASVEVGFGTPGLVYKRDVINAASAGGVGKDFECEGLLCTDGFHFSAHINQLTIDNFRFGGGRYTPLTDTVLIGFQNTTIEQEANTAGQGGYAPQGVFYDTNCFSMCSRPDGQWNPFRHNLNDGKGLFLTFDSFNKAAYLGTSTISGLSQASGPYVGADEVAALIGGPAYLSEGRVELGRNRLGTVFPSNFATEGLNWWNFIGFSSTLPANGLHLCNAIFGTANDGNNLELGIFSQSVLNQCTAQGALDLGNLYASSSIQGNTLNSGLHHPTAAPAYVPNTVTAGNFGYSYFFTMFFGESESTIGPAVSATLSGVVSTSDPNLFTTSVHPNINCPALDFGVPAGTVWKVYSTPNFFSGTIPPTGVRAGNAFLGTCAGGTTFSDDNTNTAIAINPPDIVSGMPVYAGDYKANVNAVLGWRPDNLPSTSHGGTYPLDAGFSRDSPGVIDAGNGTQGDSSATLKAAHFVGALTGNADTATSAASATTATNATTAATATNANAVGGVALAGLCQSGGTGCPATSTNATNLIGGGLAPAVATKTSNYSVTAADEFILCDATAGAVIITLPTVNTHQYDIKKIDLSANTCTVATTGGVNIDGSATVILAAQYSNTQLQGNGTQWFIK